MVRNDYTAVALAGIVCAGLAAPVCAAEKTDEQTALQGIPFTLSQAITTAERHTNGKAFEAGVNVDHGKTQVIVETNGPKGVQTVIVDAQSGQVTGSHAGAEAD